MMRSSNCFKLQLLEVYIVNISNRPYNKQGAICAIAWLAHWTKKLQKYVCSEFVMFGNPARDLVELNLIT